MIWRGVEEKDLEERRCFVEKVMKRTIGRVARIREIEERNGKAGRWVLITEFEEVANKEEVLKRDDAMSYF